MSDDDVDYDDDELPAIQQNPDEPEIDKDGYPISRGGKFQAQLNPLQQKLERERKEREDKAKRDAKKAALASKMAAFGGAKQEEARLAKEKEEAEKKAAAVAAEKKIPKAEKAQIDSRVTDMMKSGIVTKTRGGALASARGRGRGGGSSGGGGGVTHRIGGTPKTDLTNSSTGTTPIDTGTPQADTDSDSSDEEEAERRRQRAAALAKATILGAATSSFASGVKSPAPAPVTTSNLSSSPSSNAANNSNVGASSSARSRGSSTVTGEEKVTKSQTPAPPSPPQSSLASSHSAGRPTSIRLPSTSSSPSTNTHIIDQAPVSSANSNVISNTVGSSRVSVPSTTAKLLSGWILNGMTYKDVLRKGLSVVPYKAYTTGSCAREVVHPDTVTYASSMNISLTNIETYLNRDDYTKVFECTPEQFAKYPAWKQTSLKKKLRLHISTVN